MSQLGSEVLLASSEQKSELLPCLYPTMHRTPPTAHGAKNYLPLLPLVLRLRNSEMVEKEEQSLKNRAAITRGVPRHRIKAGSTHNEDALAQKGFLLKTPEDDPHWDGWWPPRICEDDFMGRKDLCKSN